LDRILDGDARAALTTRICGILTPAYEQLGAEPRPGDTDRERALRGALFEALGTIGANIDIRARARVLLAIGALDPDPALVAAAINIVAASGTAAEFDDYIKRMKTASTPQEELRFLGALADFPDPALIKRLVAMTLTEEIRTQNAPLLLRRALSNPEAGEVAWQFVRSEWDSITNRLPSNSIARLLEGVRNLSQPQTAAEVMAFFETHEVPQGDKILAQHLERLKVNLALRQRETQRLSERLLHNR
ncbi:MAG: ERAP1-like C-terminal domain-containing protein, partial [Acidimicrobiales bacterium]